MSQPTPEAEVSVSPAIEEATARPWQVDDGDSDLVGIFDANGAAIAYLAEPSGGHEIATPCAPYDENMRRARLIVTAVNAFDSHKAEIEAAFHRGVDAAKDAIRTESNGAEGEAEEVGFWKSTFISAIARKCGRDSRRLPQGQVEALAAAVRFQRDALIDVLESWHEMPPSVHAKLANMRDDAEAALALVESPETKENS